MSNVTKSVDNLQNRSGAVPFGAALPMALQHVIAMVVGCITVPMIVSAAAGVDAQGQIIMIQATMLVAAIGILLQAFNPKGVGSGLPVMIGAGFAFMPSLISIASEFGMAAMVGAQLCGGIIALLIGFVFDKIRFLFPPLVTASVVITIGISLYPTAISNMAGGVASAPTYGSVENWAIAMITLITVIICGQFGKGTIRSCSTLIGIAVGYGASMVMGNISFDSIANASWLQFPEVMYFGMEFEPSAIIMLGIVFAVNTVQDIGQFEATSMAAYNRAAQSKEVSGGVVANSISSIIGSVLGGAPVAACGQNVGIVVATKAINRAVFAIAGGLILVSAFVPKISALLLTMPQPVLGGATLTVFASMAMTGVRMLSKEGLSNRSVFICGLSVAMAIGIVQLNAGGVLQGFPYWFVNVFGKSQVVLVAIISVVLNLVLPKEQK